MRRPPRDERILRPTVPDAGRLPRLAHVPGRYLRAVLPVSGRSSVHLDDAAEGRVLLVECRVRPRRVLPGRQLRAHRGLRRVHRRLHHLHLQWPVQLRPGLRRSDLPGVHVERSMRAERGLPGHAFRNAVHVLAGHGLLLGRDVRVRGLFAERPLGLRIASAWLRVSSGPGMHQRLVRRLLDVRGLQHAAVWPPWATQRPGLHQWRLRRVLDQRPVRRRDGVRGWHLRDVLDECPVRPVGAVHRRLLHVLLRAAMFVGPALRFGRLRIDVERLLETGSTQSSGEPDRIAVFDARPSRLAPRIPASRCIRVTSEGASGSQGSRSPKTTTNSSPPKRYTSSFP
jgi:hypothetical protein